MSSQLQELNLDPVREARATFAFVALADFSVPAYVYGRLTAQFPTMDHSFTFENLNHLEARDNTTALQFEILSDETTHASKFLH